MLNCIPKWLVLLALLACSSPPRETGSSAHDPAGSEPRAGEELEPSFPNAARTAPESPAQAEGSAEAPGQVAPEVGAARFATAADSEPPEAPAAAGGATSAPAPAPAVEAASAAAEPERIPWLAIDRGEGALPLFVPRSEELAFRVVLDLGILGSVQAGRVTLSSGVERYTTGLPLANAAASVPSNGAASPRSATPLESGWIKSFATGGYRGYRVEHELRSRLLPQEWPRIYYTDDQTGSENRRRELKIGTQDGQQRSWYRHDGHCRGCDNPEHFVESNWAWGDPSHCKKCKRPEHRVWRAPATRDVPPQAMDMLGAVYLARTMIQQGQARAEFAMVDKQKLWDVHLKAGRERRITTPAGRFDCREVLLSTTVPPGEPVDPDDEGFEGMFGIRGRIQIWMEARTGVPVLIEGELPVPLLGSLDVRVELADYRGTPPRFAPAE